MRIEKRRESRGFIHCDDGEPKDRHSWGWLVFWVNELNMTLRHGVFGRAPRISHVFVCVFSTEKNHISGFHCQFEEWKTICAVGRKEATKWRAQICYARRRRP